MKLEWIILAEGLGQDAKSAITAIGIGQNVLIAPTLPAVTKRAILAHFVIDKTDDDAEALKTGDKLLFRVSFVSPSGKVIQAISAPATLAPMPWPDLPVSIDMPAEMFLTCPEYGRYEITIEADLPDGETINGHLNFYVREGPPPPAS